MRRISISFSNEEYIVLSQIARAHNGNLSSAVRSMLHRESVTKSLAEAVDAQIKLALEPILEAGEAVLKNQADFASATRNNFGIVLEAITKKR